MCKGGKKRDAKRSVCVTKYRGGVQKTEYDQDGDGEGKMECLQKGKEKREKGKKVV